MIISMQLPQKREIVTKRVEIRQMEDVTISLDSAALTCGKRKNTITTI
jgi:hypothetical protein